MIPEIFIAALIAVESGGDPNAIADAGKAVGVLQIHRCVVTDVNRIAGTSYRWPDDCKDIEKSKAMLRAYLEHYCKRDMSTENMAKTWNGGPAWKSKPPAVQARLTKYFTRVLEKMPL